MGVTLRAYGSDQTVSNFVEDSHDGPNWGAQPVSEASTTQLVSSFQFDGGSVVFRLNGSFPESALAAGNLSGVASAGATVSAYELSHRGSVMETASFSTPVSVADLLAAMLQTDRAALTRYFAGNDVFYGSEQGNSEGDDDGVHGYAGNDTFYGYAPSTGSSSNMDKFYGGDGIDTAVFRGSAAQYQVRWSDNVWMPDNLAGSGYQVVDTVAGRDGSKALRMVERLSFSDKSVALDIDAGGNALKTMQIVSLVAPSLADNLSVRGQVLSMFDGGLTMQAFAQQVVDLGLLPRNNSDFIGALYANIFKKAASTAELATLTKFVDDAGQANVLAQVAEMGLTVNLVGLQQNGMDYLA